MTTLWTIVNWSNIIYKIRSRYFVIVSCYFNLLSRNFKMLLCNFILQSRKNVTKYFSYLNLLRFRTSLLFSGNPYKMMYLSIAMIYGRVIDYLFWQLHIHYDVNVFSHLVEFRHFLANFIFVYFFYFSPNYPELWF